MKPGDSTAELGQLTSVLLVVLGLLNLVEVGILLQGWIGGIPVYPPTTLTEGLGRLQILFAGTICLWLLVVLAAAVLFLLWLHQRMAQLRSAGREPPRRGGPLGVAIQVLSLLVPYPQMKALFAAEGTLPGDRDPLLGPWLVAVGVACVVGLGQMALPGGPMQTSAFSTLLSCIRELAIAAAALLGARFISELDRRIARRGPHPG